MYIKSIINKFLKLKNKIFINIILLVIIIFFNFLLLYLSGCILSNVFILKNKIYLIKKIFIISIIIRFFSLLYIFLKWFNNILSHNIIFHFIKYLRNLLFKIFFTKNILNNINNKNKQILLIIFNSEILDNIYIKFFLLNIRIFFILIIFSILSFFISKLLFLTSIFLFIYVIVYFIFIFYISYNNSKNLEILQSNYISKIISWILNIKELCIFDEKKIFKKNLYKLDKKISKKYFNKNLLYVKINSLIIFFTYSLIIINIYIINNEKKYFFLFPYIIILFNISKYINNSINDILDISYFYKSTLRVENLFNKDIKTKKIFKKFEIKKNDNLNIISIYNLSFKYIKNKNILNNINLYIKKKSKILFIGHNGSGKSTLINLISKIIEYKTGKIFINNLLIKSWKKKLLRDFIGVSPQKIYVFNKSLRDNINICSNKINDNIIIKILKNLDLIHLMKNKGLNSKINYNLSNGEKKRIGIARILLKNYKILIFDEPTNGLNINLENNIFKLINKISFNKTLIISSHVIKFPKIWDCIYVLEYGKIIEWGNHYDLIKLKKKYFSYYNNYLKYEKLLK